MSIRVVRGQTLSLLLEFFQGDENSARIDLTGAEVGFHDSNFRADPSVYLGDPTQGEVNVFFAPVDTRAMSTSRANWFQISVTLGPEVTVTPRIEVVAS